MYSAAPSLVLSGGTQSVGSLRTQGGSKALEQNNLAVADSPDLSPDNCSKQCSGTDPLEIEVPLENV